MNWDKENIENRAGDEDCEVMKVSRADGMKIIGKLGVISKRIRTESGAHVNLELDQEDENGEVPLKVSGTFEAVDKARGMILDCMRCDEPKLIEEWSDEVYLKISQKEKSRLMQLAGVSKNKIQMKTKAIIGVEPMDNTKEGDLVIVRVVGSIDGVANSTMMIKEFLKGKPIDKVLELPLQNSTSSFAPQEDEGGDKGSKGKSVGKRKGASEDRDSRKG